MVVLDVDRPEFLRAGERARLIPVVSEKSKEKRAVSCTLASLMSVNEFARDLLISIGLKLGKTSKIDCFTEVVFHNKDKATVPVRPDGLIVITKGKRQWMALLETKTDNKNLSSDQIEAYLDLAKEQGIDAVITLSNQFSETPKHHPVSIAKTKLRTVKLYHWSWTFLLTEASMWVKHRGVSDPDQSYILTELVRYLQHDKSGVTSFDKMQKSWKDLCDAIYSNIALKKTSPEVRETVMSWHEFLRDRSLKLMLEIGENVTVFLKRSHRKNIGEWLNDDAGLLVSRKKLTAEFNVFNAAGRIKLTVDMKLRLATASMRLDAPKDRPTAKGRIAWIVNQLKKSQGNSIEIRAIRQGRTSDTIASLKSIRAEGSSALISDYAKLKPTAFEILLSRNLARSFRGRKTFIREMSPILTDFYSQAGQYLRKWVPPPPKIEVKAVETPGEKMDNQEVDSLGYVSLDGPSTTSE